jgi:hypothetical protein
VYERSLTAKTSLETLDIVDEALLETEFRGVVRSTRGSIRALVDRGLLQVAENRDAYARGVWLVSQDRRLVVDHEEHFDPNTNVHSIELRASVEREIVVYEQRLRRSSLSPFYVLTPQGIAAAEEYGLAQRGALQYSSSKDEAQKISSLYVFARDAECWQLRFEDERGTFPDLDGLHVIWKLLRWPNPVRPFTPAELLGLDTISCESTSEGELMDDPALKQARKRLEDLQELISHAESSGSAQSDGYLVEQEQLFEHVSRATGLGGRKRELNTGSLEKRARDNLSQHFSRTLKRIAKSMPCMAEHLKASIQIGKTSAYRPASTTDWNLGSSC